MILTVCLYFFRFWNSKCSEIISLHWFVMLFLLPGMAELKCPTWSAETLKMLIFLRVSHSCRGSAKLVAPMLSPSWVARLASRPKFDICVRCGMPCNFFRACQSRWSSRSPFVRVVWLSFFVRLFPQLKTSIPLRDGSFWTGLAKRGGLHGLTICPLVCFTTFKHSG